MVVKRPPQLGRGARAWQGVPVNVGVLYTVRPAESLFDLAARFYTTGSHPAFTPRVLRNRSEAGKRARAVPTRAAKTQTGCVGWVEGGRG